MQDVYECCPKIEGERFMIRQVSQDDCEDMLRIYSDEQSVPLFNSDNCHGDDFHYVTMERVRSAIEFWFYSYMHRYFVRWAVVDKTSGESIGAIELFKREADDWFTDCGILRLDLRSDYEVEEEICSILALILEPAYAWFGCSMIATKAVPAAKERIQALKRMGFTRSNEKLIGHDGEEYGDYFVKTKAEDERENMHELAFRFAHREDCEKILFFIRELAKYEKMEDEVVATPALLEEWIFDKQKAEVIFPMVDGKEIGFALFFHNFSTFLGRAGLYLEDLFILPEYRGKGYGKATLKELARIAQERGCGRLEWWCLDWNKPSIDFYLSLGAQPMNEWTTYRLTGKTLENLANAD